MQSLQNIKLDGEKPQEKINLNFKLVEDALGDLELRIEELEERVHALENQE